MMKTDLDLIQGVWNITSLEMEGQQMPGMVPGQAVLKVKGDRFTTSGMGAVYEGTVVLGGSARLRQIDMTFDAGPEKGNINYGIYQLTGDNWKICVNTLGGARPASFKTKAGSGCATETLTRGAAKARPAKKFAAPKATGPVTELEGEWQMMSGMMDGKALDPSMVQWVKRVTAGNVTTVLAGPQVMLSAEFTLGKGTIDYVHLAGKNKGGAQTGIFDLKGDMLRVFMAAPGAARPAAFPAKAGKGETLTVWKRSS